MFPQPKRHKKDVSENNFHPFPIDNIVREQDYNYSGYFTGINVEIFEEESVKAIYENGSFGIGSKTRAAPKVLWKGDIAPSKVLKKIYEKKCEWREQIGGYGGNISIDVIQENATDQHPEDDTKKSLRIDPFHIEETLVLTLEESFFLHSTLKCLRIMDVNGKEMQTNDILLKYCSLKPNFWTHFVAYLYLRSKNWIVKCGLKFGGDYLLYKKGPRYYHASYIVLVRSSNSHKHSNNNHLHGHYRISETSKKELLIIEIYYPEHLTHDSNPIEYLENLHLFQASEITMKRFNFQQEH